MTSTFEYATVAQVRAFADNPDLDSMADATLEEFISRAEGMVNEFAGQVFTPDNKQAARMTGDDSNWIQLPNSPLQRILRVVINDTEVDPKFIHILAGGRIQLSRSATQTVFPSNDVGNIHIDYTYGYASVPGVVTNAAVVLATILAQGGQDGIVQSQSDGRISISSKVGEDLSAQAMKYLEFIGRGSFANSNTQSIPQSIEINSPQGKTIQNINR